MHKTIMIVVVALLLGAQSVTAQSLLQVPVAASQTRGHVWCIIEGVAMYREGNCLIVERLLKGHSLPFGPDLSARDDITLVCEKRGGFMDNRYQGAIRETREAVFETNDGFGCFKAVNAKGEAQFPGPWVHEARELQLSTARRPNVPMGATARVNGGRKETIAPTEFRTTSLRADIQKRK